jgi:hypothetical protein
LPLGGSVSYRCVILEFLYSIFILLMLHLNFTYLWSGALLREVTWLAAVVARRRGRFLYRTRSIGSLTRQGRRPNEGTVIWY